MRQRLRDAMTLYFAYGSNMRTARLRTRAPSARVVGTAVLPGHTLRFHKRARDDSAKCDAVPAGAASDEVWGVLFEIDDGDWDSLDRAEGRGAGYERVSVEVTPAPMRPAQPAQRVQIYLAQPAHIDETLLPYSWYRDLVAAGARAHGLPAEYVARIEAEPAIEDPDRQRDARERSFV